MGKALRLSEKWFQRGLWLIALIFASFLIGLGGLIVGDLPRVDNAPRLEDFLDMNQVRPLNDRIALLEKQIQDSEPGLQTALQAADNAASATQSARETFDNWIATRHATGLNDQDAEVLRRTRELDDLKATERKAQEAVEKINRVRLQIQQSLDVERAKLDELKNAHYDELAKAERAAELRVFLARLAFTLPLLAIAGWLFVKRKSNDKLKRYWPFVWGFIFFALFAFFVELVPYLPSYGGYVRYIVGVVLTLIIGHYAIVGLQSYLDRQRQAEALPDQERRRELSYDVAQERLAKGICPGCERPVDLHDTTRNFCMHCGLCLFNTCGHCHTRKNAFAHFCHSCGKPAQHEPASAA